MAALEFDVDLLAKMGLTDYSLLISFQEDPSRTNGAAGVAEENYNLFGIYVVTKAFCLLIHFSEGCSLV